MANTAHRPSESHREWVKNRKGERVRNTAYKKPAAKTGGGRDVMKDVLYGGQEPVEKQIGVAQAREILNSPGYDAYGAVRLYGTVGEGEYHGQRVTIKSVQNLERYKYSDIVAKGPASAVENNTSKPFDEYDTLSAYTDGDDFVRRCLHDANKIDTTSSRSVVSGSLHALADCLDPDDVDRMTDYEVKKLWAEGAAAYADNIQHYHMDRWTAEGGDPDDEPEYTDPFEYHDEILAGDEVPRDILAGRE